ncbi:dihydrofolate reductase family protein [Streptacidiphilus sp. ASG 303]|uniref:dihydrofolate reductase family protein n=1 Tax=Streptacidiphilus sp. ASG 303 TaxID=2896847 RepID=UPI001E3CB4D7|nr:dihydrofolate reductase family protein [Streptacidiphilus sp. ASG 303]MCD0484939.1 dihydrofolate reductase family protein [Streptacidiphilus sp. ASG 303]
MGKVVVIEHVTLDGVMQAPGRPDEDRRGGFRHGGWATERQDPLMQQVMGERMSSAWALLLGRTTYADFADYWPKQGANPFTEALDQVRKYVVSTTATEPLPWQNSTLLTGEPTEEVAGLKKRLDEKLVVFGSGLLVRSLLERALVDELVLMIHPIVLGSGRRLFADTGNDLAAHRLTDSRATGSGVIIAVYGRADT